MEIAELLQTEQALILVKPFDLQIFAEQLLSGVPVPVVTSAEPEQPISQSEAVKFLGKSRQSLLKFRKKKLIRAYKLSGRIYYKKSELLSALKSCTK